MQRKQTWNMSGELHSLVNRVPLVYTTRLEDMVILRKDFCKQKFKDSIKIIIAESKPIYKAILRAQNVSNTKRMCFKKLNLCRQRNNITNIQKKIMLNNADKNDEILMTNKSNDLIENKSEKVIKLKEVTNETTLKALTTCKPVRIVLEDIKTKSPNPKVHEVHKDEMEVIEVLSSDDEEVKIEPEIDNSFYTITNTDEYKDLLINKYLGNSVIVFYNHFLDDLDAYEIDETCKVVNCINTMCSKMYKCQQKRSSTFSVVICCWRQRQYYVSLLQAVEKYRNIAKYMHRPHPCVTCACCCKNNKTNCNDNNFPQVRKDSYPLEVESNILSDATHISHNTSHASSIKKSKFISKASAFKKESKWNGKLNSTWNNMSSKKLECNALLRLCDENGITENYELGDGDKIYSKLITRGKNDSSWLSLTLSVPRTITNATFNGPLERESQIHLLKNDLNNSVSNYLRIPVKRIADNNKSDLRQNKGIPYLSYNISIYSCKVEYNRCFLGANNKLTPVLPILPQEFFKKKKEIGQVSENERHIEKNITSTVSDQYQQIGQNLASAPNQNVNQTVTPGTYVQMDNQHIGPLSPLKDMEKQSSECVDSIIKNILHRFRDINLTINSQGKISASLNAPLSSLSPSELQILSNILKCAQNQVDELGLTNFRLTADTEKLLQLTHSKNSTNNGGNEQVIINNQLITPNISNATTTHGRTNIKANSSRETKNISDGTNIHDSTEFKVYSYPKTKNAKEATMDVNTKSNDLSRFSMWINKKKIWYESAFRNFIADTMKFNSPKIVDVFSLHTDSNEHSRIHSEEAVEPLEKDQNNEKIEVKSEDVGDLTETKNKCLNEIHQQISLLDEEISTIMQQPTGQKRPITSNYDLDAMIIKKGKKRSGK